MPPAAFAGAGKTAKTSATAAGGALLGSSLPSSDEAAFSDIQKRKRKIVKYVSYLAVI